MKYVYFLLFLAFFSCANPEQHQPNSANPQAPSISSDAKSTIDDQVEKSEMQKNATTPKRHRVRMGDIQGEVEGYFDGEQLNRIEGELITENGKEFDTYVYEQGELIYSTHFQYFNTFSGQEGPYAIEQKLYYVNNEISQVEIRTGAPQNEQLTHKSFELSDPDLDAIGEMYHPRLAAYTRALGKGRVQ